MSLLGPPELQPLRIKSTPDHRGAGLQYAYLVPQQLLFIKSPVSAYSVGTMVPKFNVGEMDTPLRVSPESRRATRRRLVV